MATIQLDELTKTYGRTTAVDHLSFVVHPGRVTGFLGPNGAGKSTTMRLILGLDRPTSGSAFIDGRPFGALSRPLLRVGALLDPQAAHGGRTARNHLLALAVSNAISPRRIDAVLEQTGIAAVAHRRIGTFSLGMRQRLGIAAALLGDPAVMLFDEPTNGLDPEGISWMRVTLRELAGTGRAVLVSSHLMAEMAVTADHLVIVDRGRLLVDTSMQRFVQSRGPNCVRVRTTTPEHLRTALTRRGLDVRDPAGGADRADDTDRTLTVRGVTAEAVGAIAAQEGVALLELSDDRVSLEQAYLELITGSSDVVDPSSAGDGRVRP